MEQVQISKEAEDYLDNLWSELSKAVANDVITAAEAETIYTEEGTYILFVVRVKQCIADHSPKHGLNAYVMKSILCDSMPAETFLKMLMTASAAGEIAVLRIAGSNDIDRHWIRS